MAKPYCPEFFKVTKVSDFEIIFDSKLKTSSVFVYGRKVKDFCTISYERIVPLLVSSIKEQAKQIEELRELIQHST